MRKIDDFDVHGDTSGNTPPWEARKDRTVSFVRDNWPFLLIGVILGAVLSYNIFK
jgi:hypothetical protein